MEDDRVWWGNSDDIELCRGEGHLLPVRLSNLYTNLYYGAAENHPPPPSLPGTRPSVALNKYIRTAVGDSCVRLAVTTASSFILKIRCYQCTRRWTRRSQSGLKLAGLARYALPEAGREPKNIAWVRRCGTYFGDGSALDG